MSGLNFPLEFVQDPSAPSLQYVVEQGGTIRVIQDGVLLPTPFLDVSLEITTGGERGLLGLAFSPDYAASGRFFVNFTDTNGNTVVARYTRSAIDPLVADPSSRFDLRWGGGERFIVQPFENHKGGHLAFGPDGYLYIALGDGGSGNDPLNHAQNPESLLGKILRIDVNVANDHPDGYVVPGDNPFTDGLPVAALHEIWAFGLRNPWKFTFDDLALGGSGAMLIADVGQAGYEEVDYQPPGVGGRNYGWRTREGAHPHITSPGPAYLPLIDPIIEYDHNEGRSITGGYVYRGTNLGPTHRGRYFYADFVAGRVWSIALVPEAGGEVSASALLEHTDELGETGAIGNVSAFGVDAAGELYLVSHSTGTILKIVDTIVPTEPGTLFTTETPAFGNVVDNLDYELGMRLFSDVAGQITAIRFWKAPNESGTHVGRIWSASGQLLASVTFSGESASGWQQQALPVPLAVAPQVVYTVSVNTTNRSYVASYDTFATEVVNGPLHAPAGTNGVFAQGAPGTFPTASYRDSNYFRDVVFVEGTLPPDTTPPTVTITAPEDGATVSGPVTLSATADDDVGVAGVQFTVDGQAVGGEDTSAPYSVTWNSATVGNGLHTVSATARDGAGHETTTSVTVDVSNDGSAPQTLFTTETPTFGNVIDNVDYEMGMRLFSDVAGQITAIRFWKAPHESGTHVGRIWSASGQLLASVTFSGESASGWQQQALPVPLAVAPQVVYTVSVNTTNSSYVASYDTFANEVVNGPLHAPAGTNGVFAQGAPGTFPTASYRSSNYFRDVVFVPQ